MNRSSSLLACAGMLLLLGAHQVSAQSFTNGNFELGTQGSVGSSTTAVTGWTTTVGGGSQAGVYRGNNSLESWVPNAQNGSFCVQLDGSSPTSDQPFLAGSQTTISQTFTLLSAGTYTLSFYLSGEVGTGKTGGTVGVLVSLTGSGLGTGSALSSREFTIDNSGLTVAGSWAQRTVNFTVVDPSKSITLTFADDNTHTGNAGAYTSSLANYTASSNAAIDNVTITAVVPEPSTWALLSLGAVGAGVVALRRRQAVRG